MKRYLSFGAGVNSTALMLLLLDEGVEFEAVFVDTGCEWPETYDHLDRMLREGYEFTWLKPIVQGENNLYDYLMKYKTITSVNFRFCTSKFKTRPFYRYVEKPCTVYIGYDFEERRRRYLKQRKNIKLETPLISRHIGRNMCGDIIRDHGLPIPPKSGCWLCPFQKIAQWKRLRDEYPILFKMAMDLEEINPRGWTFLEGMRLSSIWQENTLDRYLEGYSQEAVLE